MSMATDATHGSFSARGEVLVADQVFRPEVRSSAHEEGLLVATFEPPGPSERGRLALLVESAVENALEGRGAPPPGIGASSDLDASLSDQLYRARLVGARGLALAVPPLEGIANLAGALDAEDSAVLRWWFAASRERPVRLILDSKNRYLGVYGPPASLLELVDRGERQQTLLHAAPEVAASAEAMTLCAADPVADDAVSVSPCIAIEAEPMDPATIAARDEEMARREAELIAAMSVAEPPVEASRHPMDDATLPPPVLPFDDDLDGPDFDVSDVHAEVEEPDLPRAVQGELFGDGGLPSFPRLVEAMEASPESPEGLPQPEPTDGTVVEETPVADAAAEEPSVVDAAAHEGPRSEPVSGGWAMADDEPASSAPADVVAAEDDWTLSPALAAASFEAAIESLRALDALRALDGVLSERPPAHRDDEHFDIEAALADCEPSPPPPSEALLSAPFQPEQAATADAERPADESLDDESLDDESLDDESPNDEPPGGVHADCAAEPPPATASSAEMAPRTRALLGDLRLVDDEDDVREALEPRDAAATDSVDVGQNAKPVFEPAGEAAELLIAPAPAAPRATTHAVEPDPSRPEPRRMPPLHPGAEDAWPLWIRDLEAARGPKPLSVVERLFVSAYVPLSDALECGVAGPEAREALDTWGASFERSYCDAFDALRLRGKRPTMVLDLPEVALRIGRLHGARSIQLLLVDGMRFDLGLRMHEKLKGLVGQAATCAERLLLWSALPSTTSTQLQLIGRGPAGLRDIAGSGADVPVARGDLAAKPRRVKTGHRELLKLDLVEASMSEPGGPLSERLDSLAGGVARSVAEHIARVAPRTLVVVFGDHGFRTAALDGGTTAAQHGGARPEEVLVPAFAWLTGSVH